MSTSAADAQASEMQSTIAWLKHFRMTAVLGAAGVVSAPTTGQDGASDPGVTMVKDGGTTGEYDLTFPQSPGYVSILATIVSPASTIGQMRVRVKNDAAGTASVIFATAAGTAAYGASGDVITLDFFAETRVKT